jgi:hypothetical protein
MARCHGTVALYPIFLDLVLFSYCYFCLYLSFYLILVCISLNDLIDVHHPSPFGRVSSWNGYLFHAWLFPGCRLPGRRGSSLSNSSCSTMRLQNTRKILVSEDEVVL